MTANGALQPPRPGFAAAGPRYDPQYYPADSDDEQLSGVHATANESALDFVMFDEDDEIQPTAAEATFSNRVEKEGNIRRARSRREANSRKRRSKESASAHSYPPTSDDEGMHPAYPHAHSYHSELSAADSPMLTGSENHYADARRNKRQSDQNTVYSTQGLLSNTVSASASTIFRDEIDDIDLDVSAQNEEDTGIIAGLARKGRPNLDAIFDDEIAKATGKIVVACASLALARCFAFSNYASIGCGPTALNVKVRNMVASRISISRIAKGDQRGNISLVVEDFQ